jgi:Fe-S cluster assembly ATP-binding protein
MDAAFARPRRDTADRLDAEQLRGRPVADAPTPAPLLEIEGLALRRDGRDILRGIRLTVEPGEVHGLLGPNGSGKSSLAYATMGCDDYRPDRGRIRFAGADVTALSITARARLGLTLAWQEPARFEGLTVADYLAAGLRAPDRDRLGKALTAVNLAPAVYLARHVDRTLSGGERKRVELAAVIAMQPRLAILDEPDSGIDVLAIADVAAVIRQLADAGTAILLITHRDETLPVADAASLLQAGRIVATGEPGEVRAAYHRPVGAAP